MIGEEIGKQKAGQGGLRYLAGKWAIAVEAAPPDDIIFIMVQPIVQPDEGRLLNGRYQLLERFGSGGMANIYRARDTSLDRYVAIKVLRDDKSRNADFDLQFQLEARAAANLSHPNIVTVYDFGIDNGQPFIVMELVPGTDLKSLLRKRGRFSVEDGIPLMVQACAGLGYAHRAGLVHCDVKPHNMLVTPDNRLKVTDFGIARCWPRSARTNKRTWCGGRRNTIHRNKLRDMCPARHRTSIRWGL